MELLINIITNDALFIVSFIGLTVALPWIFFTGRARIYWGTFFVAVGILLGIYEIVGICEDGRTISQMFQHWSIQHPSTALWVLAGWGFAFLMLIVHLGGKLLKKKLLGEEYNKPGKHGD